MKLRLSHAERELRSVRPRNIGRQQNANALSRVGLSDLAGHACRRPRLPREDDMDRDFLTQLLRSAWHDAHEAWTESRGTDIESRARAELASRRAAVKLEHASGLLQTARGSRRARE